MTETEFLEFHKNADVILVDKDTNKVVAVEYRTVKGIPRDFPVRYWINGHRENI